MDGQLELSLRRPPKALTVTQLVRMVRDALDGNLDEFWVVGEISNARMAPSGHLYLTLKDARSALAVVMFRTGVERQRFKVTDGMQVLVRGRVSLYEARGALQVYAEEIVPRGLGALQMAFEQLKQRLAEQGLFDEARKRPLPFLPHTIGLVTALHGAALRDMLAIMLGRYPNLHILIRPAQVQGVGAAAQVVQALDDLNRDGRAEVIIVGRGGGSLEDLAAFNDELVARAIAASAIPVISAVGHEIDFTIADFVADRRAPTPSAAAQMVVPARAELKERIDATAATLLGAIDGVVAAHRRELRHYARGVRSPAAIVRQSRQRLDELAVAMRAAMGRQVAACHGWIARLAEGLAEPRHVVRELRGLTARAALQLARGLGARLHAHRVATASLTANLSLARFSGRVAASRAELAQLHRRLESGVGRALEGDRQRMVRAAAMLDSLSPLRVLERGYAVVSKGGVAVTDSNTVAVGDELSIRLWRGNLRAIIRERIR